ncbi:MAG: hypothetical protein QW680_06925 [Pyrobaculum sp.]
MEKISPQEVVNRLKNGENIEILGYDGDLVIVDKIKGVVKGEFTQEDLSELKKRKPRGKPTEEQLRLAAELGMRLIEKKRMFKVIFGPREVTVRTGNGFIRITEKDVRLAGYKNLEEDPVNFLIDVLRRYGEVKLLKPLK